MERRNDSGYRCVWIKPNYEYRVFDVIVELLLENGGRARKGNGRNYILGEPECDETTVVGTIAKNTLARRMGNLYLIRYSSLLLYWNGPELLITSVGNECLPRAIGVCDDSIRHSSFPGFSANVWCPASVK